jgi:hypothetical protein
LAFLGPWPSNNHNDLKVQFFFGRLIEFSLILEETKVEKWIYILLIQKEKVIKRGKKVYPYQGEGD